MNKFHEHLSKCKDFDTAIVKGHLLTEYALEKFIEMKSIEKINIQEARFTYSNKVEVSKILGLFKLNKSLYNELKLLNKLRNSIAHKLEYDMMILNEFLKNFDSQLFSKLDPRFNNLEKDISITIKSSGEEEYKIKGDHLMFCLHVSFICGTILGSGGKESLILINSQINSRT
ncbi:MAG: hypothetical protein JWP37_2702 [Mucilaginibacter sp.]|nr:hypothetical protein [Mucilaginibacter sp.]